MKTILKTHVFQKPKSSWYRSLSQWSTSQQPLEPSDPTMNSICLHEDVLTGPLKYTSEGSGKITIVMVHGAPGSHKDFRWLTSYLKTKYHILRFDLPGFGETPPTRLACKSSPNELAHLTFTALQRIGIQDNLVFLGHSLGGPVAIELTKKAQDKALGLVTLCSVGLRPHHFIRPYPLVRSIAKVLRLPIIGNLMLSLLTFMYRKVLGFPKSTSASTVFYTQERVEQLDFQRIDQLLHDLQDTPSLAMWAEDDPMIEDSVSREMASRFQNIFSFEDGGHNIQKTHAKEVAEKIDQWISNMPSLQPSTFQLKQQASISNKSNI